MACLPGLIWQHTVVSFVLCLEEEETPPAFRVLWLARELGSGPGLQGISLGAMATMQPLH